MFMGPQSTWLGLGHANHRNTTEASREKGGFENRVDWYEDPYRSARLVNCSMKLMMSVANDDMQWRGKKKNTANRNPDPASRLDPSHPQRRGVQHVARVCGCE